MKRVLVLSDSHGNVNNMILAVRREKPEMIIHWEIAGRMQNSCRKNARGFHLSRYRETVTADRNFWKESC